MTTTDGPPQGFKWEPAPQPSGKDSGQFMYGNPQQMPQGSDDSLTVRFDPSAQPETQAVVALVVSVVAFIGGILFFFPFFLAPVSWYLANKSLHVTKTYPGHSEHGMARAAQILSVIIVTLLLIGIVLIGMLIGLLSSIGF